MNPKLNEQFFKDIGKPDLSEEEKLTFTNGFLQALDVRVNYVLLSKMNEAQLAKFNSLVELGDEVEIDKYKKSQFPELDAIVQQEFGKLKQEVVNADSEEGSAESDEIEPDDLLAPPPPLPPKYGEEIEKTNVTKGQ